jgi:3-isopropylmalate/(R)-2-methylmalate dehydratase small subunit
LISGLISTDDIIPARYKHMYTDPAQMAPHVFEARFPGLAATLEPADMLVGSDIFGIGSSREQAVSALMACGVRLVVAPEFGRIFYRNSWNLGLPAIQADPGAFVEGQRISVDLPAGRFSGAPGLPSFAAPPRVLQEMVEAGGLLKLVRRGVNPADMGVIA